MVRVPPDKYVVVLRKGEVRRVALGGSVFVNPLLDTYAYIPCDARFLDLNIKDVESSEEHKGVRYDVKTVMLVTVMCDAELIAWNAHQLIGMTDQDINTTAMGVVEDVFRRYARYKTPIEVQRNRGETARWIMEWANDELNPHAIQVRSFVIKEMEDAHGYFDRVSLGTLDLWLQATDEHGRIIPELREEYEMQVRLLLDG
jgi:uncharacterized membrane protein YqiK